MGYSFTEEARYGFGDCNQTKKGLSLKSTEKRFNTTSLDIEHVCNHNQRINLQKRYLFCYNFMKRINRPLEKVPSSNFMFSQKKKKKRKKEKESNMSEDMECRDIFSE